MNIDLLFKKDIEDKIKKGEFIFKDNLHNVRGLTVSDNKNIIINLSAEQWNDLFKLDEDSLIDEISKTLAHEVCHLIIRTTDTDRHTLVGEEKVCMIFAGQLIDKLSLFDNSGANTRPTKNETFI